ncbi:MAG: 4-hydroxythreonine-4-phosphate dehydrogenase PdxA [Proteobacteria bacterium]|nr:4-hydroxythreonine-4-phosphate dehydrogenase PdxA [Pseudomonadota bacterium]MDA0873127.1 4-hydroxythreonine-4-phosphate dehydrogenase PdxA [Pseudomonadota bacterium]MDA1133433.1 4-hydroxythreonine-4-phosphate dehydrogenase PdxA [Pseudomonadota bacterium]
MKTVKKILISMGDPAGIGPDLCVLLSEQKFSASIVIVGNKKTIYDRAKLLNKKISLSLFDSDITNNPPLTIIDTSYPCSVIPGKPNKANSYAQFKQINFIVNELLNNNFDAMVTLPISKKMLSAKLPRFKGHTEYISELANRTGKEVMMLASQKLKVALVTTHVSLKAVPLLITRKKISDVIKTLNNDLKHKFKIKKPKIIVTGLNPHSGEDGEFGNEEKKIIIPVIKKLNSKDFNLIGPLPADTAFTKKNIGMCDAFLAMYHDQGLAPFKALSFGKGVNITLGLPFVRTSVDHGTAFSIAGTNMVDPSSFFEAIEMAIALSQ